MSVATVPLMTETKITHSSDTTISLDTELRHLPPWVKARLGHLLDDKGGHWLAVMASIPRTPPWYPGSPLPPATQNYPKKYTAQECKLLENEVTSGRLNSNIGSGICLLLEEWGCSGVVRPMLADLINLFKRNNLLAAATFLTRDVLRESSTDSTLSGIKALDEFVKQIPPTTDSSADSDKMNIGHHYGAYEEYSELDNMLAEQNDDLLKESNVRSAPEFDDSVVPHLPYGMLAAATNDFSERSHGSGGHKLGEGAFGVVYKADLPLSVFLGHSESPCNSDELKEIAIKKLNFNNDRTDKQFKLEVQTMSRCIHPNILRLKGYSCDGPHWCLLYSFMVNGNLQDKLSSTENPLSWKVRLEITKGIADGLAYLHTFNVTPLIHRDVKSANVLLDASLRPKLGDFGLMRSGATGLHTKSQEKTTTAFGTSAYMAPEAFRGDVSVKLDTFSYGVVLLELLTGLAPYDENRDGRDILSYIEGTDAEPHELCDGKAAPWPTELPQELMTFAMTCVEEKRCRPTMVQAVELCNEILSKYM